MTRIGTSRSESGFHPIAGDGVPEMRAGRSRTWLATTFQTGEPSRMPVCQDRCDSAAPDFRCVGAEAALQGVSPAGVARGRGSGVQGRQVGGHLASPS